MSPALILSLNFESFHIVTHARKAEVPTRLMRRCARAFACQSMAFCSIEQIRVTSWEIANTVFHFALYPSRELLVMSGIKVVALVADILSAFTGTGAFLAA